MLNSFPKELLKGLSINLESFTSFNGFFGFVFMYISLALGIQGMYLGISVFTRENTDKTCDFLHTKPVTRIEIMTAKLLAVLSLTAATNVCYVLGVLGIAKLIGVGDFDLKVFLLIALSGFIIQIIFAALGVVVSAVKPRLRGVAGISISFITAMFILGLLSEFIDEKFLAYFTPFKYFNNFYILENAAFEPKFLVLSIAVIVASVVFGYIVFKKRDIHAV